jgi:hypothetical protein
MVDGISRLRQDRERSDAGRGLARPAFLGIAGAAVGRGLIAVADPAPEQRRLPEQGQGPEWSRWELVSRTPATPPRASAAARTARAWSSSAGLGSITNAPASVSTT